MFAALIAASHPARGQDSRDPRIGYAYPAGGRCGEVVQVVVGGQYLWGVRGCHVSGEGVEAVVVKKAREIRNVNHDQRMLMLDVFDRVRNRRLAALGPSAPKLLPRAKRRAEKNRQALAKREAEEGTKKLELPNHPWFFGMEDKSLRDLADLAFRVNQSNLRKSQPNRQLAELLLIEVRIDEDAKPGLRELRLETNNALTNPINFHVGFFPEVVETEPNHANADPAEFVGVDALPANPPLSTPVVINGQIMPGDVDRFRFKARKGQRLVIDVDARRLVPYLADAVPGWFQAVASVFDADGQEVAHADDFRFHPDPVIFFNVPADGEYELEIRDALFRGRQDFVYRISVGEQPFVTSVFPLGARKGAWTTFDLKGWNLPPEKTRFRAKNPAGSVNEIRLRSGDDWSNPVSYAVDDLPEITERERKTLTDGPRRVRLPVIVNGRVDQPGDVDGFQFYGRKGRTIVAEIDARKLGSPLDSLLRLIDANGNIVAWNDDHVIKEGHLHKNEAGLLTHHADSLMTATLPKSGRYQVQVSDVRGHGSSAHAYRLRISYPRPDFALRMTPSSLFLQPGAAVPFKVHVLREDGFDGPVEIRAERPNQDFIIDGGVIPAGTSAISMTLTAPRDASGQVIRLKFVGVGKVAGETIERPVIPADDVMQAFLWRHLVPAQELLVKVKEQRWSRQPITLTNAAPLRVPVGGDAVASFKFPGSNWLKKLKLALATPPDGVSLDNVIVGKRSFSVKIKIAENAMKNQDAANLIIAAVRETPAKNNAGPPRRTTVGYIPALPIEVVR